MSAQEDVIAEIRPRPARRWIGIAVQGTLGAVLLALGVAVGVASILASVAVLLLGGLMLWGTIGLYQSTALHLELTDTELRDSMGRVLTRVDAVKSVDRGALAFKPSNGFLLTTDTPAPFVWAPGLWWRVGRFVGVGGVTPAGEGKVVAELISAAIAARS
ncbi:MAG: hypothetical protein AAF771_12770 [Pseudomonadota bacterium]